MAQLEFVPYSPTERDLLRHHYQPRCTGKCAAYTLDSFGWSRQARKCRHASALGSPRPKSSRPRTMWPKVLPVPLLRARRRPTSRRSCENSVADALSSAKEADAWARAVWTAQVPLNRELALLAASDGSAKIEGNESPTPSSIRKIDAEANGSTERSWSVRVASIALPSLLRGMSLREMVTMAAV
eukprot:scaffold60340_cov32-Tisochrysis_lutea.AAC.4